MKLRPNSFGFCGGAFGDEGKGRIVDEYVTNLAKTKKVVVYRDNGGANAGHTVGLPNGQKVALHQLPSGIFTPSATIVLGKGMVIHPSDLLTELTDARFVAGEQLATIMIDEMAVLSLDTHRAYESALKNWQDGGKGSTGRGISPAYADVLLRQPLRMRDLVHFNQTRIEQHYALYEALVSGLGTSLAESQVAQLAGQPRSVGNQKEFINRLRAEADQLKALVSDVTSFLNQSWADTGFAFVFEKAQAIGLDYRWGVYPDVTASDTTFEGIESATEGIISPLSIKVRAGVIKATYMSSVGTRVLPTMMEESLANRIREDAHEYGATTKRPRGIAYLDLPALRFYTQVGKLNCHVLTHMDIAYEHTPIKVCVRYELDGKEVAYRPDQEFLLRVKPVYEELPSWSTTEIQAAKTYAQIPRAARDFLRFMSHQLRSKIMLITTGPQRHQSLMLPADL